MISAAAPKVVELATEQLQEVWITLLGYKKSLSPTPAWSYLNIKLVDFASYRS